MMISKFAWQHRHKDLICVTSKRTILSNIFPCGCFGGKKKQQEDPPIPLTINSKIVTKGMCMPILGLGTWLIKTEEMNKALCTALDHGYRHIDTSYIQGNEKDVGENLHKILEGGRYRREELFITSKLPYYGMKPAEIENYVKQSLENLRLSYLDLYLIHFPAGVKLKEKSVCPDPHTNHLAIWKELEKFVECGKIKSLGLSNFNKRQLHNILQSAVIPPANLQVELHLYCQQKELRKFCKQHAIGVTAYAPLGSPGLPNYLRGLGLQQNEVPQPLENPVVNKIAKWHNKCPSHILLRHILQMGGVAVIPKSSCPDRIIKNTQLFDFSLSPCEINQLNSLDNGEEGRMFSKNIWVGTAEHSEYPFGNKYITDSCGCTKNK